MKNIELVRNTFENMGATCNINDNGNLEVMVELTAYGGYGYTFGAELTIDEDTPAENFLSTWSMDGLFMDFNVYDTLASITESEEEYNEVGAAFECWICEFENNYNSVIKCYDIEGVYTEDMLNNMNREFILSFNMEANSLRTMTNKELTQYLRSVNEDIAKYREENGDALLIACNDIMDNSITLGDLIDGLFKKNLHPDVIKLACRYFIASAVVEELNKIRKGV